MDSRGQISSQVFVYILVAVIILVIATLGIKGIGTLLNKQCLADIQRFKQEFERAVEETRDIGEMRVVELRMPCKYYGVCFYDFTKTDTAPPEYQPAFVQIKSDSANVFLIKARQPQRPEYVDAFNVSKLLLNNKYMCVPAGSGLLRLKLEGSGKLGTRVSLP